MNEERPAHIKHFDPTQDNPYESALENFVFNKPWVRTVAVTGSVIASIATAVKTVHKLFYDENKEKYPYDVAYKKRIEARTRNEIEFFGENIFATDGTLNKRNNTPEQMLAFKNKAKEISKTWSKDFDSITEQKGIVSHGWNKWVKGTIQKAETLSPGDAAPVVFRAMVAFGITFGAYMATRQTARFRSQLNAIDDKVDRLTYDLDKHPSMLPANENDAVANDNAPHIHLNAHQQQNMYKLHEQLEAKEHAAVKERA